VRKMSKLDHKEPEREKKFIRSKGFGLCYSATTQLNLDRHNRENK